jgi:tetratricopeptide (TPR) repeat protein
MAPFGKVRFMSFLAGAVLLLQPVAGQQQGGTPSAPPTTPTAPGGGGGGTTTPPGGNTGGAGRTTPFPSTNPNQQPGQQQTPFPEMNRPIFLSGKVVTDDGTPPPETAVIERVCNGVNRPEAYTDSKGRFSFELGKNQSMFVDASMSGPNAGGFGGSGIGNSGGFGSQNTGMGGSSRGGGGISERDLMGCEIRAVLPGYRSESVNLANRRAFDNPDIGTILLHRLGKVEGRIISATSLNAPKDAKKAFEKGQDLVKKKKADEAMKSFQKAVESYPKYAAAWYEMGRLQEALKQDAEARKSYEQALAADAKYLNPYLQLAGIAARASNWQDLADATDRAIKLDPFDYPQAYFYNSVANYNLKKYDAAERSAREAQKLDTRHEFPKTSHLLGILLAEKRDFSGAAEQMRNYLKFAPGARDAATVRTQLTEIEKLSGDNAAAQAAPKPE